MENLQESQQIIANRYRLIGILGEGGSAVTYKAKDLNTGDDVALKVLSLRHLDHWQKVELFESEAKILQQLEHPHIPKYLDYFENSDTEEQNFYIVEQLAPGKSLATLIEEGWQPDEETVKKIATQLLEILIYLQELLPPVIHRDIKPQNIIYNNDEIFLVDFGTVQETYRNTITASIAVGTPDYMAPEQMGGKANLSTDLYGLGMTLLFLLTGNSPMYLPQRQLKVDFRKQVNISPDFANWLEKMIEPKSAHRFPNAQIALNVLQNPKTLSNYITLGEICASYTSVNIRQTEDKLLITIPPAFLCNGYNRFYAFIVLLWLLVIYFSFHQFMVFLAFPGVIFLFSIFSNYIRTYRGTIFVDMLTVSGFLIIFLNPNTGELIPNLIWDLHDLTIPFFSIVFFLQLMCGNQILDSIFELIFTTRLEITPQEFCLKRKFFHKWMVYIKQNLEQITEIKLKPFLLFASVLNVTEELSSPKKKPKSLTFNYTIGNMLTQAEKLWLREQINSFLPRSCTLNYKRRSLK